MVHERLEDGRCVGESEEHDHWFVESKGGNECRLPLVLFSQLDVVVFPSYVELGKEGRVLHVIDKFWDERQWIGILDSEGIKVPIVLTGTKGAIFLWDEEEWGCLRRFGRDNTTGLQMFLDEGFAGFHFKGVQQVHLGDLWDKVGF